MKTLPFDFIDKHGMLADGDRVLCALSGGADSVCMTHFLCSIKEKYGITLAAAHFSHGIREDCAQAEKQLVTELCESLCIPCFCESGDAKGYAKAQKISLEDAARRLRYNFLQRVAESWGASKIATAHNISDNAETVLINMARGTGTLGLSGIPPVRDNIIRPILDISREEIEQYNGEHNLKFAIDETNFDRAFSRNRIRAEILPQMQKINSAALKNILNCSEAMRQDADFINQQARELVSRFPATENSVYGNVQALLGAHEAVAGRAIRLLYCAIGGKLNSFTLVHAKSILALCKSQKPSGAVNLPDGIIARRSYDSIALCRADEPHTLAPMTLELGEKLRWGQWEIEARRGESAGFLFDMESLKFPLTVRSRREGDSIKLEGGTKSIKKFMIDYKIPQVERDITPIICDNERVIAVGSFAKVVTDKNIKDKIEVVCRRIKK